MLYNKLHLSYTFCLFSVDFENMNDLHSGCVVVSGLVRTAVVVGGCVGSSVVVGGLDVGAVLVSVVPVMIVSESKHNYL